MRPKIVVPTNREQYQELQTFIDYFEDSPEQIAKRITEEDFFWLDNHQVWEKLGEIAESTWISYNEEEEINDKDKIRKCKEWLLYFRKQINEEDKTHLNLVDDIIILFEEALSRNTPIIFLL